MYELRHTNENRDYDDLVISTNIRPGLTYHDLVVHAEKLSKHNEGIFYIRRIKLVD